ncbi:MAG TPA: hypothetical protein VG328_00785 [Stellaceae bacterium]|jgi:ABC-type nitrate/sulfonate/bicarbonate transport system substrate-binding protein|nr:hypothetical protein [Stellaceae bacterium]
MLRGLITAAILYALAVLPAQAATKIDFMYTAVASWVGLFVAKDQEILAKHNLDIGMTLTSKDPANDKSVRASLATYTKLPPAVTAVVEVPKDFYVRISPDALSFWVQVSREQGLIKGNPDPKSLIYP